MTTPRYKLIDSTKPGPHFNSTRKMHTRFAIIDNKTNEILSYHHKEANAEAWINHLNFCEVRGYGTIKPARNLPKQA